MQILRTNDLGQEFCDRLHYVNRRHGKSFGHVADGISFLKPDKEKPACRAPMGRRWSDEEEKELRRQENEMEILRQINGGN